MKNEAIKEALKAKLGEQKLGTFKQGFMVTIGIMVAQLVGTLLVLSIPVLAFLSYVLYRYFGQ